MSGVTAPHHDQHPAPDPQESLGLLPRCLFWGHFKQMLKAPDGAEESTPHPALDHPPTPLLPLGGVCQLCAGAAAPQPDPPAGVWHWCLPANLRPHCRWASWRGEPARPRKGLGSSDISSLLSERSPLSLGQGRGVRA